MGKRIGQESLLTHCRLRQHSFKIGYLANKKKSYSKFIVLPLILNTNIQKLPVSEMSQLAPHETFYTACHKTPTQVT